MECVSLDDLLFWLFFGIDVVLVLLTIIQGLFFYFKIHVHGELRGCEWSRESVCESVYTSPSLLQTDYGLKTV